MERRNGNRSNRKTRAGGSGSTTNSSANIITDAVTSVHSNPSDGCTEGTMALESSEVAKVRPTCIGLYYTKNCVMFYINSDE